jgi:hypothetical protein
MNDTGTTATRKLDARNTAVILDQFWFPLDVCCNRWQSTSRRHRYNRACCTCVVICNGRARDCSPPKARTVGCLYGDSSSFLAHARTIIRSRVSDIWRKFFRLEPISTRLLLAVRRRAAIEALPFESPKLSAMAVLPAGDFADRLERAIARSGVKLIEEKSL